MALVGAPVAVVPQIESGGIDGLTQQDSVR